MSKVGSIEAEQADWDHIFNNHTQYEDTNNHSAEVEEQLNVDLDAAEWSSWDIGLINGYSGANNLSLPEDQQAVDEYLIDTELQDDHNNNIEKDPANIVECQIDCTGPVIIHEIPHGDQLVSECTIAVVTNSGSKSKSMETNDGAAFEEMEYKGLRLLHLLTTCAEAMSQQE